jgi:uncharacterized protein
MIGIS